MKKRRMQDLIEIHAVIDKKTTTAWIHTHGMHRLDFPELEIRDVPKEEVHFWASMVNCVAEEMRRERGTEYELHVGQTLVLADEFAVTLSASTWSECDDAHEDVPIWKITLIDPQPVLRKPRVTWKAAP